MSTKALDITPNLEPLFGTRDENLRLMEDMLHVRIDMKQDAVMVQGAEENVARVQRIFADYEALRKTGIALQNGELNGMVILRAIGLQLTVVGGCLGPFHHAVACRDVDVGEDEVPTSS